VNDPRWTVYSGRLLNLCIERAMLLGQDREKRSETWPTLRELAQSRYVRARLDKGCA
jgi:hypothetical protein